VRPRKLHTENADSFFPRVLVVTQYPFNLQHGAGIALSNYFHGWPEANLAQLCIDDPVVRPDFSVCKNIFLLSINQLRPIWPLRMYLDWRHGKLSKKNIEHSRESYIGKIKNFKRNEKKNSEDTDLRRKSRSSLKGWVENILAELGFFENTVCRITPDLDKFIQDFRPEIVFSTLGDIAFSKLPRQICSRYGAKSVVHITDDWMSYFRHRNFASMVLTPLMYWQVYLTVRHAHLRYSICETMAQAYEIRFKTSFQPLISPVKISDWKVRESEDNVYTENPESELTVLYAGTIYPFSQGDSLKDISSSIARLREDGMNVQLVISTPKEFIQRYSRDFDNDGTRIIEYKSREDLPNLFRTVDALVIPVVFDDVKIKFARYSMPAKIIAYMATGVPMLVYGPSVVPAVIEANKYGFAHTATTRDPEYLKNEINRLLTDSKLRVEISSKALTRVRDNYELEKVTGKFRQNLCELVDSK